MNNVEKPPHDPPFPPPDTGHREPEISSRGSVTSTSIERMAGCIAHDFNNILGIASGLVEVALDGDDADREHALREIQDLLSRAGRIGKQLQTIGRGDLAIQREVELDAELRRLRPVLERALGPERSLVLDLDAGSARIAIDPSHLDQVFLNLILNAHDATEVGGTVTLSTTSSEEASGGASPLGADTVHITVRDDGHGMREEVRAKLFEPYFSTKPGGTGHGLGLASVKSIVDHARGALGVESSPGLGTAFHILLPTTEPTRIPDFVSRPVSSHGRRRRILVVDDEPGLREITTRLLTRSGYECQSAPGGPAALDLLENAEGPIDILVTDASMAPIDGVELARRARALHPRLAVLVVSGFAGNLDLDPIELPGVVVLSKPFSRAEITEKVHKALRGRPPKATPAEASASPKGPLTLLRA